MLVLCKFATQFVFHQLALYAFSCLFKITTHQTCRKQVKSLRRRMGLVAQGTFMCKLKNAYKYFSEESQEEKLLWDLHTGGIILKCGL
jgi:dolichyl-phosphate-mannose--protein O-mannosyl transferase